MLLYLRILPLLLFLFRYPTASPVSSTGALLFFFFLLSFSFPFHITRHGPFKTVADPPSHLPIDPIPGLGFGKWDLGACFINSISIMDYGLEFLFDGVDAGDGE